MGYTGKRFKNLSTTEIEYIKHIYYEDMSHEQKMDVLTKKFDVSPRAIRKWWKDKLNLTEEYTTLPEQLIKPSKRELHRNTNVVLYTSCQNKTGINSGFLRNLVAYKKFLEEKHNKTVSIVIAPTRYRNPTNPSEDRDSKEEWWVDEVQDYLYYGKIQFGDTILSTNTRISPTAKEPLTSFEVLAKDNNLVLPHSKIHFKTLPRFKNKPLRVMSTTGYISNKNYSDSKAGETAYLHHSYGFVIIEKKDDDTCYVPRNVKVKSDGSFIDIVYSVSKHGVNKIKACEGFIWGDIHSSVIDRGVMNETLRINKLLSPKKTVLHDVFDGYTINPHETKDMYIQRKKIREGKHLIEGEINESFALISEIQDKVGGEINVSLSNHDVFLDRHINDFNWKKDLHNSSTYLEYAKIQQTEDMEVYGSIYGYLLHREFKGEVKYLNYGSSLDIEGYECALHGDHGTNGSRGSYKQFSRINTKMISAHSHSPVMHNSVTVVGLTSMMHQYYNRKGISSWAWAHSVIHSNGKNQLLVFDDSKKISSLI